MVYEGSFLELQSCDLNQTGERWLSRPALGLGRTKSLLHWVLGGWAKFTAPETHASIEA